MLQAGDKVVHLSDPLHYGVGTVQNLTADGKPMVKWSRPGFSIPRPIDPHELVLHDCWPSGPALDTALDRLLADAA
jgi:hypothetical protein